MNNRRAIIGFLFLIAPFISLVLLAWAIKGVDLKLLDFAPIVLEVGGKDHPLMLGHISAQIILLSFSLVFLNLIHEFFGKTAALFTAFVGAGAVVLIWFLLGILPWFPGVENADSLNAIYQSLFDFSTRHLIIFSSLLVVGFNAISLCLAFFRKITKGYFLIICLFLSHLVGFAVLSICATYLTYHPQINPGLFFADSVKQYIQWFFLFIFLLPVYYFFYFIFLIIIGQSHYREGRSEEVRKKSGPFHVPVSPPVPDAPPQKEAKE